jgi:2-dehydropantoate 2-reductase
MNTAYSSSDRLPEIIYVLGCGAIGFPLAAYLANAGRRVIAVRTSREDIPQSTVTVTVDDGANCISVPVETISLSKLTDLNGIVVIATKSYANDAIALALKDKPVTGSIVIMQNGVGIEKPFLDAGFSPIYRCVVLLSSQATSESKSDFRVRRIAAASPIGSINGDEIGLNQCVAALTTDEFPFSSEANIQREIWRKTIVNSVFNSICPLLDADNGIFARNEEAANLAKEIVRECITLTNKLNLGLSESELMEQIIRASEQMDGQMVSTLQDIHMGNQTEIDTLNLEIAHIADSMQPQIDLPETALLGKMIVAKSLQQRSEKE